MYPFFKKNHTIDIGLCNFIMKMEFRWIVRYALLK